jgi:hypothetical protein
MFGHGRVLPHAWRRLDKAHACARYLAVKAARRMRRAGFAARALAAWLTDKRSAGWFGEERFQPIWDDRSILASLGRLFGQASRDGIAAGAFMWRCTTSCRSMTDGATFSTPRLLSRCAGVGSVFPF